MQKSTLSTVALSRCTALRGSSESWTAATVALSEARLIFNSPRSRSIQETRVHLEGLRPLGWSEKVFTAAGDTGLPSPSLESKKDNFPTLITARALSEDGGAFNSSASGSRPSGAGCCRLGFGLSRCLGRTGCQQSSAANQALK